ncbi:hypothetical protein ALC57_07603 [Trachymyrmex cornetzi]|uniref:Uncharacterized protein n=1 Tax=Trachymyrmex cornetzi TaxID=471704 RepID=A0A151J7P2_9HYME|nr:hypothetical protein ALC57_07603 [Trachymyrmex cornetzi]
MSAVCASDQHYPATNRVQHRGIHSPRCSLPRDHSVTEFGGIETSSGSSPTFYVSLYVCLIDPSVIRRDGFPVRKARRWARRPRESFEALVKN